MARKKLIEVALPLEAINKESAREKSIRHGHPSTLHLWWARRPLAACRAVLFASLVDDPDDDPAYANYDAKTREHLAGEKRQQLFELIEELVKWENSNNEQVINAARAEIARCVASRKIECGELKKDHKLPGGETVWDLVVKGHGDLRKLTAGLTKLPNPESVNAFLAEHAPPVLDPFCGGGSIPLEAQRLGLRAYGSDLNPVPVLITKALIEIPPKFANMPPVNPEAAEQGTTGKKQARFAVQRPWKGAEGLAADVGYYGQWMRDQAQQRIGHLYPKVKITAAMAKDRPDLKTYVGEELTVIAWLWARTVASPNPAVRGAHVPLVRSFRLCTRKGKEVVAVPVVDKARERVTFTVRLGAELPEGLEDGTVTRRGATCLLSNTIIPLDHIRQQGQADQLGRQLLAIVVEGSRGRVYLSPTADQVNVASDLNELEGVPDTELPPEALGFRVQNYGILRHRQMFLPRQLVALSTFTNLISEARRILAEDDANPSYADSVCIYLALAVSRCVDYWSGNCSWHNSKELIRNTFARNALPMVWDAAETNPFSGSAGNFSGAVEWVHHAISRLPAEGTGQVSQANAADLCESGEALLISSDPPYYDNVPYADLSDLFYVWLRRSLKSVLPDLLDTVLVPKSDELVADPFRHGGREKSRVFFEQGMTEVFRRLRKRCTDSYPTTIYYAFKQTEEDDVDDDGDVTQASTGWETILEAMITAGWSIDGTWPLRTELGNRMRSLGSNALASSVVLACRRRPLDAALATRREFLNALKRELPEALRHLQRGNIAPVDLAQASIGPGMAIYSRYSRVMESSGEPMSVRSALTVINQTLDEVLAEQEGEFDADTRWALAWFEQYGMEDGPYGVAETLSKAKNTAVNGLVEAGVLKARAGKARLVTRDELPADWDPAKDKRLTIWEIAQHLIRTLDQKGEQGAAELLRRLGGKGEIARDLAYRLYSICERKKWAQEAMAYNSLVIAWPEITRLAQGMRSETQGSMF